ncbi:MAG: hypothetical protein AVDCRST_MAG85-4286, partial [uncultured Solirubrobacteraceae bacterium]
VRLDVLDRVRADRRAGRDLQLLLDLRERDLLVLRDEVAQRPRTRAAHVTRAPQEHLGEDLRDGRDEHARRRLVEVRVGERRDLLRVGRLAERRLDVGPDDEHVVPPSHVAERLHEPARERVGRADEGAGQRVGRRELRLV